MIRLIIATITIIAAITCLASGVHPSISIGLGFTGLTMITWRLVSMEEQKLIN